MDRYAGKCTDNVKCSIKGGLQVGKRWKGNYMQVCKDRRYKRMITGKKSEQVDK